MQKILTYVGGGYASNSHLYIDTDKKEAALFDASVKADKLKERLASDSVELKYIILTHGHYDHIMTLPELCAAFPTAELLIGRGDGEYINDPVLCCSGLFDVPEVHNKTPDRLLSEGDEIEVGEQTFRVLSTPGHTPGSCCFLGSDFMMTGDTLFAGNVGRYDLPGGDRRTLIASLERLKKLPFDGKIYSGHGNSSTLETERKYNPYLLL